MSTTTMFVRNTQPGPTVYDEDGFVLRWEGAGDSGGGDVLPVPSSLADDYNFQRCLHLGIFQVIEANDETNALIEKNRAAWNRQMFRQQSLGQLPFEEGSVPQEFVQPKAQVGPGELRKTLPTEVGVTTEEDRATPKIKDSRVVMGPRGSYF
jgi:hypothetical protein